MSYTLIKSDGTTLATLPEGTIDSSSTGLSFPGPNFIGYGQYLNQNLLKLLENFASNIAPTTTNIPGQLWFNKSSQTLNVFTTNGYTPVSSITPSGSRPTAAKVGDIWLNTNTNQTYIYNSGQFNLIGPEYTRQQGVLGAIPATVLDGFAVGVQHNIIELIINGSVVATVSADPSFTPQTAIPGFPTINPGITLSSLLTNPVLNSNLVGSVTGDVTGNLTGTTVTATNLYGTLTGQVIGNLTGTTVTATNLYGTLTGNIYSTGYSVISNLSAGNVLISGGSVTGLTNLSSIAGSFNNLSATTLVSTNLSSANAVIIGGSVSGLSDLSADTVVAINFSSSNVLVAGGAINNLTTLGATSATATNFSTGNAAISGGTITGLTEFSAGTGQITNFTSANITITGGRARGLFEVSATSVTATTLTANSATFSSGVINNLTGNNVVLTSANITSALATTQPYNTNSNSVATTAFVQSVLPAGMITLWYGLTSNIPQGWQLCNGSNGTPDLRGQFVVGAGGTYNPGDTGGANSVTLDVTTIPSHAHAVTATGSTNAAGSHSHSLNDPGHFHSSPGKGAPNGGGVSGAFDSSRNPPGYPTTTETTNISVNSVGDHTHNLSLSATAATTGGGQPHENRPPYYALCYIMKMY